MALTDKLSIPNLVISACILLVLIVGKAIFVVWIIRLQKEQRRLREEVGLLKEQVKSLPATIVGELMVGWDLVAWRNRLDNIEPRVEYLERRMNTLNGDENGTAGGTVG